MNFAALNQLILKDLKNPKTPIYTIGKYKRSDVASFLDNPVRSEKQLRDISITVYNKSAHYKRLIQYFSKMLTLDYIVEPVGIDFEKVNKKTFLNQYKKVLGQLDLMNIKHEFSKILNIAFREDIFYGYEHQDNNSYFIQKLNPDYCMISSIEDGCLNFAFDFAYFAGNLEQLEMYPKEFKSKYNAYLKNSQLKWQELDSSKTVCIKINEDLEYLIPPFAASFEAIFEIADYKALRKDREEISNYAVLIQKLPMREDSEHNNDFLIDYDNMMMFHNKAAQALPDQVGLITTPFEVKEVFFKQDSADSDNVEKATRDYWTGNGVSQLLFNTDKSSSIGLENSIKTDEEIVFTVLRQIERWINRRLKFLQSNISFRVNMLNTTIFNKDNVFETLFKASQFGYATKMLASAALGMSPSSVVNMSLLENEILGLPDKFIPLESSHTAVADGANPQGGAPKKKTVTDEGLKSRDKGTGQ